MTFISENWKKINDGPVCFGAKDDSYGNFSIKENGLINTFKLVHRSGSLKCHPSLPATYWGCSSERYGEKRFNTVITDNVMVALSLADYSRDSRLCGYKYYSYQLDGIHVNSTELVYNMLSPQLSVSVGQEFHIWYGEDLTDCDQDDNSGKTCADVYAWYV